MHTMPTSNAFAHGSPRRDHRIKDTRRQRLALTWHLEPMRIARWTLIPCAGPSAIAGPRCRAKIAATVIHGQGFEVERQ